MFSLLTFEIFKKQSIIGHVYSTAFSVGKFENYKEPIHVTAFHFRGTLVILKINSKVYI